MNKDSSQNLLWNMSFYFSIKILYLTYKKSSKNEL